jgi:Spy/CpxP family protein refolding chaperone
MKKLYLILSFVCTAAIAAAQDAPAPEMSEKKQQDIEALKAAFITKELELTPDEAKQFWPVYDQYDKEMREVLKNNKSEDVDVVEKDQKVIDVKKKYKERFTKVLGNQGRTNRLFTAEGKFRKILIRALQQRQMKRNMRRPGLRNN